jgi:four helix bundle protein
MRINNFKEMDLWKKATSLAIKVYSITDEYKLNRDFSLKEQIRKSAISIPSNITEGFERNNNNEFITFLRIAKASCAELSTQLYIAKELSKISLDNYQELEQAINILLKNIGGFISYLKNRRKNKEFILK